MKCPHCGKDKNNVFESRKLNAEVWRRRLCQFCHKTFVTQETTSTTLKFPSDLNGPGRQKARLKTPSQKQKISGPSSLRWKTTGGMSTSPQDDDWTDD
jgi:hypothetical protein